ncbi:hypothetical protein [Bacillus sp. SJS]|uniref:hypothetical protein n=1 Tax=Bacillus sp. SJS TaxID=1423321 RepID=UPI0004DD5C76|nr:hypothetical protein [Bacillus sp. SJS]KZZ82522.1 hypothetical protein AS29_020745 [Bacillus sp. SJS]
MINATFGREIAETLTTDYFISEDFLYESSQMAKMKNFTYKYRYKDIYYFKVFPQDGGTYFDVRMRPGSVMEEQALSKLAKPDLLKAIKGWLHNIKSETENLPFSRQLKKMQTDISDMQDKFDKHIMEGDNYFSQEEGNELRSRLEQIESRLAETLDESEADELKKLTEDVEGLKALVATLSKKNWLLALSARMYHWGLRNPNTAKQLGRAARELLPQGVKDSLPNDAIDQLLIESPVSAENDSN